MTASKTTTDHDTIREWAQERNGRPARVEATAGEGGLPRIDFDEPEDLLEEIAWDEFFATFEENRLAFLYREKLSDGSTSRFSKLVNRDETT